MNEVHQALEELKSNVLGRVSQQGRDIDAIDARLQKLAAMGLTETRDSKPWLDVKSLVTGNDTSGGYLVPDGVWGSFIDRLRPASVLLASGVQVIRTTAQSLLMPKVTGDPTATWRGEMESLTGAGEGSYGLVRAVPKKVAAYVVASRELIEDSTPGIAGVLERQITASLGLALDAAAFASPSVNALAAPTPFRSMPNVSTLANADGTPFNAGFGWFLTMLTAYLEAHGNPQTAALYMSPGAWAGVLAVPESVNGNVPAVLHTQRLANETTRSIFGVPVYLTTQIPQNETIPGGGSIDGLATSVYMVDTAQIAVVVRQDTRVELDRSRHFDQDAIGVRGTMRADLVALHPETIIHQPGMAGFPSYLEE